jgi:hypothetical protein
MSSLPMDGEFSPALTKDGNMRSVPFPPEDALAVFAAGTDSTLIASDAADLHRELDAVTARVSNPSIPFLAR